mmetsp:Transcript_22535/g.42997  ORF Transcript_22535/g.42997 Transcript_22535/m.42997 type:complete len:228 (+) Transcript_22535:1019-1702(+)
MGADQVAPVLRDFVTKLPARDALALRTPVPCEYIRYMDSSLDVGDVYNTRSRINIPGNPVAAVSAIVLHSTPPSSIHKETTVDRCSAGSVSTHASLTVLAGPSSSTGLPGSMRDALLGKCASTRPAPTDRSTPSTIGPVRGEASHAFTTSREASLRRQSVPPRIFCKAKKGTPTPPPAPTRSPPGLLSRFSSDVPLERSEAGDHAALSQLSMKQTCTIPPPRALSAT